MTSQVMAILQPQILQNSHNNKKKYLFANKNINFWLSTSCEADYNFSSCSMAYQVT